MVPAQSVAEDLVVTVLNLHASHDLDGITERQGQEEVRFDVFQTEDQYPERNRRDSRRSSERRVRGGKRLVRQVFSVLAGNSITEHSARGHDGEHDDGANGDGELYNTDNQGNIAALLEERNVDRGSTRDCENDQQEHESSGQVAGVVPGCRDVRELGKCSDNHDETGDRTTQRGHGEDHWPCCSRGILLSVDTRRVPGGVDPEDGDVHDPDTVKVDQQMEE